MQSMATPDTIPVILHVMLHQRNGCQAVSTALQTTLYHLACLPEPLEQNTAYRIQACAPASVLQVSRQLQQFAKACSQHYPSGCSACDQRASPQTQPIHYTLSVQSCASFCQQGHTAVRFNTLTGIPPLGATVMPCFRSRGSGQLSANLKLSSWYILTKAMIDSSTT